MFDLFAVKVIKQCDPQDGLSDNVQLAHKLNTGNGIANKFDISDSHKRGGKLLHYRGPSDASISPDACIY
ncbi:tannase and feruloyl esterase [Penicillium antarcticum]|uniref:tannase and feruloyl esterase n=1 Tax=Penicillium antarcticum TaxID=416450 RepID=UPI002397148F|nr:tannase and feruloyl esterase [Penicillium antarcticum]KAJ5308800.1 tannase and feruloyl esterase [Penicillium antarcticum]